MPRRTRTLIIVSAAVVIVLIVVGVLIATAGGRTRPDASGSNSTPGSTPASTPSSTSSPTPFGSATHAPQSLKSGVAPAPTVDPSFGAPVAETVDKTAPAQLPGSITARILSSTTVTATGTQVGEVSGPAVKVVVQLANGSAADISLDAVTVNGYYGTDLTPASPIVPKAENPGFSGSLAPGAATSGTYVFSVPEASRSSFVVTVSAAAGGLIAVFK
jgi:hypothetical protein